METIQYEIQYYRIQLFNGKTLGILTILTDTEYNWHFEVNWEKYQALG